MQIQSKLPNVGTTIFTVMSVLANEHKAINLGQGFPDYAMDEALVELYHKAMQAGFNQYTHMNGLPLLRERIAEKVSFLYAANVNPETQITVTPGGTYAIYTALTTILQPGDEVIVFEPAYDCYIPTIELNGAVAITIPLRFPDYSIDWDAVREKISERTKCIMINSPHNPTGAVLSANDIVQLKSIVLNKNIFVLSDEVYEHLIFGDKKHESILAHADLMQQSFVTFSFGKVYNCTGWKLGYCIAPPDLMKEFRKIHQFNCFTCNTPAQVAIADYITHQNAYLQLGAALEKRKLFFEDVMKQTQFRLLPTYGSYFQCATYEAMSDETDRDFAIRLVKEVGVATIPVSAFYKNGKDDKVLRFCFAKKQETIEQAVANLMKWK
jgi:methionine transaminase